MTGFYSGFWIGEADLKAPMTCVVEYVSFILTVHHGRITAFCLPCQFSWNHSDVYSHVLPRMDRSLLFASLSLSTMRVLLSPQGSVRE